jgi:hypothetical protein
MTCQKLYGTLETIFRIHVKFLSYGMYVYLHGWDLKIFPFALSIGTVLRREVRRINFGSRIRKFTHGFIMVHGQCAGTCAGTCPRAFALCTIDY